ncbi:hypothetical protein FB451DRAFT_1241049, partial [Mycena latifolia]
MSQQTSLTACLLSSSVQLCLRVTKVLHLLIVANHSRPIDARDDPNLVRSWVGPFPSHHPPFASKKVELCPPWCPPQVSVLQTLCSTAHSALNTSGPPSSRSIRHPIVVSMPISLSVAMPQQMLITWEC